VTGFSVEDWSHRNRNLRLQLGNGDGYFIKLGVEPSQRLTLSHEARAYEFIRQVVGERTASVLPRLYFFNTDQSILVLELYARDTIRTIYAKRPARARHLTGKLGSALGRIHRALAGAGRFPAEFETFCPLPLELWRPSITFIETCSAGQLEFLRMLQRDDELCHALESLRSVWLANTEALPAFIHGDMRLDNCCLAGGKRSIRIVDWELAGRGDQAWDVGAVFADMLSGWLMSMPICSAADPSRYTHLAQPSLDMMKSAAHAFWSAYADARGVPVAQRPGALEVAMRYAAARLVQLSFEQLRGASAVSLSTIGHLQMSANLLARPIDGGAVLFGLVT
jgi:aminoglycoside phosphotransferase (APT) family kinase protein